MGRALTIMMQQETALSIHDALPPPFRSDLLAPLVNQRNL